MRRYFASGGLRQTSALSSLPWLSIEAYATDKVLEPWVQLALEALPSNYREVLILRELEGMSYREISEVAGIPWGTVMSRLSRAREQLRRALVDLTGGAAWSEDTQTKVAARN